jgi:tetratricopeptide (TPR) repeat protein
MIDTKISRALGLLGLAVALGASVPTAKPGETSAAVLRALSEAADRDDCEAVLKIAEPLIDNGIGQLPEETQIGVYTLAADCAYARGGRDEAYAYALRGSALSGSQDSLWRLRFFLEMDLKHWDAAVATVETAARSRPAALNSTPMQWFFRLQRELKEQKLTPLRKRLLKILAADTYVPAESAGDAQGLRWEYAELLAAEGDGAGARAALAGITDPMLLLDAIYDAHLRAVVPPDIDLRAATQAALAHDRAVAAKNPNLLDATLNVATDLRRLGQAEEALALLQAAGPRLTPTGGFTDIEDKLPWYWDRLAQTYLGLGRYEDAVKAYGTGGAANEGGRPNISQLLNLAGVQLRFGHPDDALKTLAAFDDGARKGSPYGEMVLRHIRGCARAATGRRAEALADLQYAEAHRKDHPHALGYLYLCLDRPDDAAAFFIARLDDPETRGATLRDLSEFDPPPASVPPELGGRLERMKARGDVKRAIARAGGLRHIPLQEDF